MTKAFLLIFTMIACGCVSKAYYAKLPHAKAYSPTETTARPTTDSGEWSKLLKEKGGAVFEFNEGDIINVRLTAKGDLLESIDGNRAKVKRRIYLYLGRHGAMYSLDGETFKNIEKGLRGFSASLRINDEDKSNDIVVDVETQVSPAH